MIIFSKVLDHDSVLISEDEINIIKKLAHDIKFITDNAQFSCDEEKRNISNSIGSLQYKLMTCILTDVDHSVNVEFDLNMLLRIKTGIDRGIQFIDEQLSSLKNLRGEGAATATQERLSVRTEYGNIYKNLDAACLAVETWLNYTDMMKAIDNTENQPS